MQFSSTSFAKFAEDYGFTHILTNPRYLQANGEVECAVQTVKNLLKKTSDPYKALIAYRATPLESGLSLAELLMGRKIRTRIPTSPSNLKPSWPYLEQFRENDASLKSRQKRDSSLESMFGYETKKVKGLWRTKLVPHALTQLKLPKDN